VDGYVSVDATVWESLSSDDRAEMLRRWGLPPLVMLGLDKSTMTYRLREPTAEDLLAALDRLPEA
jgi:hypothetical protein